jgi:hypothetical protein
MNVSYILIAEAKIMIQAQIVAALWSKNFKWWLHIRLIGKSNQEVEEMSVTVFLMIPIVSVFDRKNVNECFPFIS